MTTLIILCHKAQNAVTENDFHSMEKTITTHTFINIITKGPAFLIANDDQQTSQHFLLLINYFAVYIESK
jgi:hypothetical protein